MREIKFRAWDKENNQFIRSGHCIEFSGSVHKYEQGCVIENKNIKLNQYTGLKDKNDLTEVYESDIIDIDGNIIGNLYQNNELLKESTNLLIQDFGGKSWCSTYKEALERGCKNA